MVRLNITLPDDVGKHLEKVPNKSKFIAEAVREKFNYQQRETLNIELAEGYAKYGKETNQVEEDWKTTLLDGDWNE